MSLFNVQSLRLRNLSPSPSTGFTVMSSESYAGGNGFLEAFKKKPHSSHPDFANLTLLVFEAVMEVVCVSLPGYIVARMGQFDADAQKFVANLNTQLFTPCLSKYCTTRLLELQLRRCTARRSATANGGASLHKACLTAQRREVG